MPKIEPIVITFEKGIFPPARLGSTQIKPGADGFAGYAQNIDTENDEYGAGAVTPGPALTQDTNNSVLTGTPHVAAKFMFLDGVITTRKIYLAEGSLGATDYIRSVTNFATTPSLGSGAGNDLQITHAGHASVRIDDMVLNYDSVNLAQLVMVGVDATDQWIQRTSDSLGALSVIQVITSQRFTEHKLLLAKTDNKIYGNRRSALPIIWSLSNDYATYTATAFNMPTRHFPTAFFEYGNFIGIAWTDLGTGQFARRTLGGRSGIIIWNRVDTNLYEKDVVCPVSYISAVVQSPAGNYLVFGGVDQSKVTIFEFTGFGFTPFFNYIGDLPRSRHSIDFDVQGRMLWITADGQICRLDLTTKKFDHLGSITTGSDAGGMLTKLLGDSNDDFIVSSGTGSTYTLRHIQFGSYLGDGDNAADQVTTPLIISPQKQLPRRGTIKSIRLNLSRNLASGDKMELRVYTNGSSTATVYGTISFANYGAVASVIVRANIPDVYNICVGVAWKMTDGGATAPVVLNAVVNYETSDQ